MDENNSFPELPGSPGGQLSLGAKHFKALIDSVPQLIWENSGDGYARYFNRRWFEFSGLTYEESAGPGWHVMVHPDDSWASGKWRQALSDGMLFEAEVRLKRADGQYVWHLLRNNPMHDEAGKVSAWFGTATEIEQIKQTDFALSQTAARLEAIMETAIDFAIITLDENGIVTDWNSGAEAMLGFSKAEAIGRYTDFFFTPEDRYGGIPGVEIKNAAEKGQAMDERWHLRKDGSRFFMSGVMKPINHQAIAGFVKIARNITDRKLAEEALYLSEQHRSLAMQSAEMGEWSYNIPAGRLYGNAKCCTLLGKLAADVECDVEDFFASIHEDDRAMVRDAIKTAIEGLNIFDAQFRVKLNKTTFNWFNVYGRIIAHVDGNPATFIGVMYDITSRKLLEKQKDEFISIASHELKSPVTGIKSYCEILEDALQEAGHAQYAQLAKKLGTQVDRLIRLIHKLLDASVLQEIGMKLNPVQFDINELVEETVASLDVKSRHLVVTETESIPLVHADRERLGEVIENLVTNALKFNPPGKQIIVSTKDELSAVRISVQDFGKGIAPAHQQRIFERYYRISDEETTTLNESGLGLGLYISSEIIRRHHGFLNLESRPGEGSIFSFTLPYT